MILVMHHPDGEHTKIEFDYSIEFRGSYGNYPIKLWVDSRPFAQILEPGGIIRPMNNVDYDPFTHFTVEP